MSYTLLQSWIDYNSTSEAISIKKHRYERRQILVSSPDWDRKVTNVHWQYLAVVLICILITQEGVHSEQLMVKMWT